VVILHSFGQNGAAGGSATAPTGARLSYPGVAQKWTLLLRDRNLRLHAYDRAALRIDAAPFPILS
jgi:hypothetical protein